MIRSCLIVALLWAGPAYAQPAPDRHAEVAEILKPLPKYAKVEGDVGRRSNLFAVIRGLNVKDGGQWGALLKQDQGGKVPADIIVWRPTLEHFDVITGAGDATWIAHGPVKNEKWIWAAVPGSEPPAPVPPAPSPNPDLEHQIQELHDHYVQLSADVNALENENAQLRQSLEDLRAFIDAQIRDLNGRLRSIETSEYIGGATILPGLRLPVRVERRPKQ